VSASIFPLQEMMLICQGCGGERQIPQCELEKIRSVDDFKKFTTGAMHFYACRCGAKTCDIRLLPNAAAQAD
jgi:hypothetical protein